MKNQDISFFNRFLSVWVLLCMVAGVTIGHFIPCVAASVENLSIAGISLPIAVLIWVMIFPMMLKVDFASVRMVGKNPKGLFLRVIFARFISGELASQYLAGAVAAALFGASSPAALAATVGVLTEVPVMLDLVHFANKTKW